MTIEERVEVLEKRLSTARTIFSLLVVVTAALAAIAGGMVANLKAQSTSEPPVQDLVRAREIHLYDSVGRLRAAIRNTDSGPHFALLSENGIDIALLEHTKTGGRIQLKAKEGKALFTAAIGELGPTVALAESAGGVAVLMHAWDGTPSLSLRSPLGVQARMSAPRNGALFCLEDADKVIRAGVSIGDGTPKFEIRDKDGQAIWRVP